MNDAVVIDVESTGLVDPEVVEVAYIPINIEGNASDGWYGRFKPSKPITLGALSTHHIADEMLADCPPSSSFKLPEGVDFVVAHNADYDWACIGKPEGIKRIDTLAMARTLWPDADSHSLGAMLYLLDRPIARTLLSNAHGAAVDARNCKILLGHILAKIKPMVCENFDDLWNLSEKMRVPTIMTFGKWKGTKIRDVPSDYKRWYCGTADADPYVVRAMKEQR